MSGWHTQDATVVFTPQLEDSQRRIIPSYHPIHHIIHPHTSPIKLVLFFCDLFSLGFTSSSSFPSFFPPLFLTAPEETRLPCLHLQLLTEFLRVFLLLFQCQIWSLYSNFVQTDSRTAAMLKLSQHSFIFTFSSSNCLTSLSGHKSFHLSSFLFSFYLMTEFCVQFLRWLFF